MKGNDKCRAVSSHSVAILGRTALGLWKGQSLPEGASNNAADTTNELGFNILCRHILNVTFALAGVTCGRVKYGQSNVCLAFLVLPAAAHQSVGQQFVQKLFVKKIPQHVSW